MATKKFGREPKMMTTEPSADELKHEGMKRGGHAHKKHMAMGGNPMMAQVPMKRAMPMRRAMAMQPALLTRKHGGKAEGGAEHRAEMKEMHKIEKELKHHESMKAGKAHHGLKAGGKAKMYEPQMGGLLGEGRPHHKGMTGGVEGPGFAHGGKVHRISGHPEGSHAHHKAMAKHHAQKCAEGGSAHHAKMHEHHKHMAKMCKAEGGTMPMVTHGGAQLKHGGRMMHKASGGLATKGDAFQTKGTLKPKVNVQDKVVEAKQTKSFHTKSGGVEGVGYKHGGKAHKYAKGGTVSESVANRYLNDMKDGSKKHTKAGHTGEIHEAPAGYKKGGHVKHHAHGGHVQHHTTHGHDDHGHKSMHHHAGKHDHGHTHIDHHPMKHGGHAKSKVSTHHKKGGKCNY